MRKLCLAVAFLLVSLSLTAQTYDSKLFAALHWRNVGPFRGGRVLAVTGIAGDPNTYYFGAVAGGVFKSTDGGATWKSLFDHESTSSIGAIAVSDSDHNVIYVGTGEACIRGNMSYGDGVYKSLDGGKTWKNVGLRDTQHIGAIIIDPKDPNTVLVAGLGHAYGPNSERGIFRTRDGGKTWDKVLYQDDHTGGIDVVFDPNNSNIVFASLWQVMRTPYSLVSGGPGSGLYKSIDGGTSWKRLEGNGLPEGIMGRIGVSVSGGDSNRVYALIESQKGGVYRSEDGGDHWMVVNDDQRYRQRAWYFTHIFADPKSADTLYVLNTGLFRSTDGGKSFTLLPAPHGDHHGLWIDPSNPERIMNSNDGGVTISLDGGKTWTQQNNQPTAQFYHVVADNRFPYYLYGSQQDNSSVAIASRDTDEWVITDKDWYDVGGGESGYIAPDPRDYHIVYAGDNGAVLTRFDKRTERAQDVSPWPLDTSGQAAATLKHRFQWTYPIVISPHDPDEIYAGAEVVFKSTDQGHSWTPISPDLTRNDKSKQEPSGGPITLDITSVEYYDTVFTIAESPKQRDLIWAGTDDGLIQLTQDGGQHWSNVTPSNRVLPEWSLISLIEASPHDAGTAYVAVDRHKNDDLHAYVYKTSDFGKTWTKIANGIPDGAYVHAVRQDPKNKNLLYAGTELGVYVSFDDGQHWQSLQLNLPTTPINDLVVKDDDLAVATNGRSFWILDDLSPLRELTADLANQDVILYRPAPTYRMNFPEQVDKRRPVGENPPNGLVVRYYLKKAPQGEITLDILDGSGQAVRHYSSQPSNRSEQPPEWPDLEAPPELLPAAAGMNHFPWNLRFQSPTEIPGAFYAGNGPEGPIVLPGTYTLKLTVEGRSYTAPAEIQLDPRVQISKADLEGQMDLEMKVRDDIEALHIAVNQIRGVRAQLEAVKKRFEEEGDPGKPMVVAIDDLNHKMDPVEQELIQVKRKSSEGNLGFPNMLNEQYDTFRVSIESADAAPTQSELSVYDGLHGRLEKQLSAWKEIRSTDVPAMNERVRTQSLSLIEVPSGKP
jgi:photosystem II stability/assembly factor-like uncharacterized protein